MKTIINYLLVLTGCLFFLSSCDNSIIEEPINLPTDPNPTLNAINFVYQGKSYTSIYQKENGTFFYEDKDVEQLVQKLSALPELATYIHKDGTIEYFDSFSELESSLAKDKVSFLAEEVQSRAGGAYVPTCELSIYEHKKYKGKNVKFVVYGNDQYHYYQMANLAQCGMANMITAMKLHCNFIQYPPGPTPTGHVTFWDQVSFKGHSITWTVDINRHDTNISNFTDYGRYTIPEAPGNNWNDAANSFKLWI